MESALSELKERNETITFKAGGNARRRGEALLRNKVDKLKKELGDVRREKARLKTALEKERGLSEHYRKNWINASSKKPRALAEITPVLGLHVS